LTYFAFYFIVTYTMGMPQLKITEKSGSRVWCTLNLSTWE